jgi:hypothetical protein
LDAFSSHFNAHCLSANFRLSNDKDALGTML